MKKVLKKMKSPQNKMMTAKKSKIAKKVGKILEYSKKGMSVAQIGKKVGLTPSGVNWHLNK